MFEHADAFFFVCLLGWCPVSKDDEAFYPFVGAEEVSPAAPCSGRSSEGHGALHQSQALRAAPDHR